MSSGNLGRHLEVLDAAGLISMTKSSGRGRPRTWIKLSRAGRDALRREVGALQQILTAMPAARRRSSERTDRTHANRNLMDGKTDLGQAVPLCWFHHRRIHDDAFLHRERPDGTIAFHRRR